jgi:polar amino acid transport system ATP-binding protein
MSEIVSTPERDRQEGPIIRVRDLHKYFGALHVIKGVDLDVASGEVVVVIGPSGGGKSTFLRCINFLEEPSAGTIEVDNVMIKLASAGSISATYARRRAWSSSSSTSFRT